MESITRTVYGSALQGALYLGLPVPIKANSTLNERFNIQAGQLPTLENPPKARYWAIGNGGHKFDVGEDGIPKPDPIQHRATDAAAFHPIPFVMRLPENDLTQTERTKYALRRLEQWRGTTYVCYYLKRIDFTGVNVELKMKTVVGGNETTTEFVPTSDNLNPQPPTLSNTGVNLTDGTYVSADARVNLAFTKLECDELVNVANIMYGDARAAIVSEILFVSGVDQAVQVSGPGNSTFNFMEAIAAQVTSFVNTFIPVNYLNNGTGVLLDVGATEPLLKLGN